MIFVDSLRVQTASRRQLQPDAETVLGVPIVADDDEDSENAADSDEDEIDDDFVGIEVGADLRKKLNFVYQIQFIKLSHKQNKELKFDFIVETRQTRYLKNNCLYHRLQNL